MCGGNMVNKDLIAMDLWRSCEGKQVDNSESPQQQEER